MGGNCCVCRTEDLSDLDTAITEVVLLRKLPLARGGTARDLRGRDAQITVLSFPRHADSRPAPTGRDLPAAEPARLVAQRVDGDVVSCQARRKRGDGIEEGERFA